MSENELTLTDKLFGFGSFTYPIDNKGRPDYGFITVGQQEYRIVNIEVFEVDGKLIERLELDNGQLLRGREIEI